MSGLRGALNGLSVPGSPSLRGVVGYPRADSIIPPRILLPRLCFSSLPPPSSPRRLALDLVQASLKVRTEAPARGGSEMAADWSCLRWRSRARLGTRRSLRCSCKLMGWKGVGTTSCRQHRWHPGARAIRRSGWATAWSEPPGAWRSAGSAHRRHSAPPRVTADGCPWPRGDRGGKKPGPSCFLAFVIGLRSCPFSRPTAKAKVEGLLASFSSIQRGDPSVPVSGGELKT